MHTPHVRQVSYILPVSDDGGSTAEVLRVLGGPAIGDIRSRLLRLASPKVSQIIGMIMKDQVEPASDV